MEINIFDFVFYNTTEIGADSCRANRLKDFCKA